MFQFLEQSSIKMCIQIPAHCATMQHDRFPYLADSIFSSEREGATLTPASCCYSLPGEVQLAGLDSAGTVGNSLGGRLDRGANVWDTRARAFSAPEAGAAPGGCMSLLDYMWPCFSVQV